MLGKLEAWKAQTTKDALLPWLRGKLKWPEWLQARDFLETNNDFIVFNQKLKLNKKTTKQSKMSGKVDGQAFFLFEKSARIAYRSFRRKKEKKWKKIF